MAEDVNTIEIWDEKKEKLRKYQYLNALARKGETVFAGSSLMEFFPVNEFQQILDQRYCIYNRGIAGYVTSELLASMETCIFELEPSKLFINIGTNDISAPEYTLEGLISNYDEILSRIAKRLPNCQVYVMSYYPVNGVAEFPHVPKESMGDIFERRTNAAIREANEAVERLAGKFGFTYIDVNEGLSDEDGNLKAEFGTDGIHMLPNGYAVVLRNMLEYL